MDRRERIVAAAARREKKKYEYPVLKERESDFNNEVIEPEKTVNCLQNELKSEHIHKKYQPAQQLFIPLHNGANEVIDIASRRNDKDKIIIEDFDNMFSDNNYNQVNHKKKINGKSKCVNKIQDIERRRQERRIFQRHVMQMKV